MPAELRHASRGEAVRDLQARLVALGHDIGPDDPGDFGDGTAAAVRAFQAARRLRVDGIVGRQTWNTLVESGFALGDRLLYFRRPMLRGDDVAGLQRRLNALGFDASREDGILGAETYEALVEFQRASGLRPDGICGSTTLAALERVGSFADGSAASIRERERLLAGPRHLAGRRVYVAAAPGLGALAEQVAKTLVDAGADAVLDSSGEDDAVIADEANRFGADLFLTLRTGDALCRCAYFSTGDFRSEAGFAIATAIHEALAPILPTDAGVCGRAYGALRETHMTAVVVDVVPDDDVEAMRTLVARAGDVGRAIVRGIQHAVEHPAIDD
ncbi:MAG: peptidoglycan-binding protein [Acidimicrobiia bacterium]